MTSAVHDRVRAAVRRGLEESLDVPLDALLETEELLTGPFVVLVDGLTKADKVDYQGLYDTVTSMISSLMAEGLDGQQIDPAIISSMVSEMAYRIGNHISSLIAALRSVPAGPVGTLLERLRDLIKREREANICPDCGLPKSRFTVVIGGRWVQHDKGFDFLGGYPKSKAESKVCACDGEMDGSDLSATGRAERAIVVRQTYFKEYVGAQSFVVIHPIEPERSYLVDFAHRRCSCPDWVCFCSVHRIDCKHLLAMYPAWERITGRIFTPDLEAA